MQKPYAKRLHDHQCVLSSPEQKPSRQWGHYIGSENRSSEIRWKKQPDPRFLAGIWNQTADRDAAIKWLSLALAEHEIPEYLSRLLMKLHAHYLYRIEQITELESELNQSIKADATVQRIMTIPGVGPMTASLLSSQLGDGKQFSCSRDFAASTGLVPRQYSTGGKSMLLGISKRVGYLFCTPARSWCGWSINRAELLNGFKSNSTISIQILSPALWQINWPE